jgi:F0F1-type ATP synthase membrane subunit b/b'
MPLPQKGAELKEQASEKVDQAKDKANELASDAKQKGAGKENYFQKKNFISDFIFSIFRSQT